MVVPAPLPVAGANGDRCRSPSSPSPTEPWTIPIGTTSATFTVNVQTPVCGDASEFVAMTWTAYEPAGTEASTVIVALAVPPTAPAGVSEPSVIDPGAGDGFTFVTWMLTTVPSASLAVTLRVAVEPSAVVRAPPHVATTGALPPHGLSGDATFLGVGAPTAKSEPLSSVSVQPAVLRIAEVVLLGAVAGCAPSKKSAFPYPTRSTIWASAAEEHGDVLSTPPLHPSGVVESTRAIFPAVADMRIGVGSTTSGVGSGAPTAAFEDSWINRYWPGASDVAGSSVIIAEFPPNSPTPLPLVYWTDQPASDALELPRLNSSMKSCVNGAPEFPPPP